MYIKYGSNILMIKYMCYRVRDWYEGFFVFLNRNWGLEE